MNSSTPIDFFSEKVQRIAHALYLITSYVPKDDPLREAIRVTALELVQSLHDNDVAYTTRKQLYAPLFKQLISYVSLAKASGAISTMNADVVGEEMLAFLERIEQGEFDRRYLFADDYFIVSNGPSASYNPSYQNDKQNVVQESREEDVNDNSFIQNDNIKKTTNGTKVSSPVQDISKRRSPEPSHKQRSKKSSSSSTDTRRSRILELFKKDDDVITMHDIQSAITDVSVKTLQRELASMVEEKIILKEGEKRWSEYRLNKS